jgi:hypothetical protein
MSNSFADTDLLDAMMRAAFSPRSEFTGVTFDGGGNPQPMYAVTPALIEPLVRVIQKKLEEDEGFRAHLIAKVIERIDTIADTIVTKSSSIGIIKEHKGGYNQPTTYSLAEWLQEPLGQLLADQLAPMIAEHVKSGGIDPEKTQLSINVNVAPWPKPEGA